MTTQEVIFGVTGQSLVLTVDRPLTSVTSVAVCEFDADDTSTAEAATTGSAAVDTATETITVAAGLSQTDPRKLTVASSTGFVAGRRYLISGGGYSETFEVDGTPSATVIYARTPLWNDYAIGATIAGTLRATISVLDAWAADVNNLSPAANPNARYRERWEVVHSDTGETAVYLRNLDLVRYGAIPQVAGLDVDNAFPGWLDSLPVDHQKSRGRVLIEQATEGVRFRLYGLGVADQALRNAEVFAGLVKAQAVVEGIEANGLRGADVANALTIAKGRVDALFARLVETPVLALDTTGAGGAVKDTRAPLRLLRR